MCENIIVHFKRGEPIVAETECDLVHLLFKPVYVAPMSSAEAIQHGADLASDEGLMENWGYVPDRCLCFVDKQRTACFNGYFGTKFDSDGEYDAFDYHFYEWDSVDMWRAKFGVNRAFYRECKIGRASCRERV